MKDDSSVFEQQNRGNEPLPGEVRRLIDSPLWRQEASPAARRQRLPLNKTKGLSLVLQGVEQILNEFKINGK